MVKRRDTLQSNFFWGEKDDVKKFHLVARDTIWRLLSKVDLGIKFIEDFNKFVAS